MSALAANSRRYNIQKAHDASHLSLSWAASGRTLSTSSSRRTGPLSLPSYIRAMAMASCRSFSWFRHTLTASFSESASRKNAAAYSDVCQYSSLAIRSEQRTVSVLAQQRVSILQGSSPPLGLLEVISQQLLRCCLLLVPASHAPQALE